MSSAMGAEQQPEGGGQAYSLIKLAVVVVAVVVLAVYAGYSDVLIVVAALVFMIMLHEFGHLVMAKLGHMKVTEYFLGFGPRIWSIKKGETEYGIKAIPAGGYVKIIGMTNLDEVPPEDEARTYRQQPFWRRMSVALAGSFTHFFMAAVMLWILFSFIGLPVANKVQVQALLHLDNATNPAKAGGLVPGDVLVSVDGHRITGYQQLSSLIEHSVNKPLKMVVTDNGHIHRVVVVPVDGRKVLFRGKPFMPPSAKYPGVIGVELTHPTQTVNPFVGLAKAAQGLGRFTTASFGALGTIFSLHGLTSYLHQLSSSSAAAKAAKSDAPRLESIYGAVRTAAQGAKAGPGYLLIVLISINVFVGLINLAPMLPLDGGHVVIAIYERIRSRHGRMYHMDVSKLMPLTYTVVLILILLFASSFYLDVTHPLANPFK
ncbi:MAG: site-2 protease family protein [Actinobacteria bacterium]|nr:site-2 protease family protein [Actinomycetota bacterium]